MKGTGERTLTLNELGHLDSNSEHIEMRLFKNQNCFILKEHNFIFFPSDLTKEYLFLACTKANVGHKILGILASVVTEGPKTRPSCSSIIFGNLGF